MPRRRQRLEKELIMVKAMEEVLSAKVVATEQFACVVSADEWQLELASVSHAGGSHANVRAHVCFSRDYPHRAPRILLPASGGEISAAEYLDSRSLSSWDPSVRVMDLLSYIASSGSTAPVSEEEDNSESDAQHTAVANLPAEFAEVLVAVKRLRMDIPGGALHPTGDCIMAGKKTRKQLVACTDYEHICSSVLGMAKLHEILPAIVQLNNGKSYLDNPGTQLMERECGFTMHADRVGTVATMRDAPGFMLAAFQRATQLGQQKTFFSSCFDRRHDPCLEGRVALFVEYLEQAGSVASQFISI